MLCNSEIDMTDSVDPEDLDDFVSNASWVSCSTYHTVLESSSGAAVFGIDMLFDIPYLADWHKNTARKNARRAEYDYVVGG